MNGTIRYTEAGGQRWWLSSDIHAIAKPHVPCGRELPLDGSNEQENHRLLYVDARRSRLMGSFLSNYAVAELLASASSENSRLLKKHALSVWLPAVTRAAMRLGQPVDSVINSSFALNSDIGFCSIVPEWIEQIPVRVWPIEPILIANAARSLKYSTWRRGADKATAELFHPVEIFERDAWQCHICHRPIDQLAPHVWNSPSIDHVVPLSRGGPHSRANVKASHFLCNTNKNDRILDN